MSLLQVLASEISVGYEEIMNTQVMSVNDHKISSLQEVRPVHNLNVGCYLLACSQLAMPLSSCRPRLTHR